MPNQDPAAPPPFGSENLRLPDELRVPVKEHLAYLREQYRDLKWAGRVGFGKRPAVIVIDLALKWTKPAAYPLGSSLDSVVEATCQVVEAARAAGIPIFFTTYDLDPAEPPSPHDNKIENTTRDDPDMSLYDLDPRLQRRPNEKIVKKKYASALRATNLEMNLASLGIDTLIITGVSTSHCVYATCRDAAHTYHVIVPREAVGERCEIMHEVNLLDIDIDLGDVMPVEEVTTHLRGMSAKTAE
jgi:maleamate amidohydrolase